MIDFDLYDYYRNNKDNNIILSFKGAVSQEILVEIGSMIRNKFTMQKDIKKIFSVFVELSQNIMHYSAEREFSQKENTNVGVGIILFSEHLDYFYISSGNLIDNKLVPRITKKIEVINSMDQEELKEYYQEQRRMPQEDGSKGAGLGFIDIARKSGNKIDYEMNVVDDSHSFFVLKVKFKKGE
jgi:hypothetical protein